MGTQGETQKRGAKRHIRLRLRLRLRTVYGMEGYLQYDWQGSSLWNAYLGRIEVPVAKDAEQQRQLLEKLKKKWYKKNVDKDFELHPEEGEREEEEEKKQQQKQKQAEDTGTGSKREPDLETRKKQKQNKSKETPKSDSSTSSGSSR